MKNVEDLGSSIYQTTQQFYLIIQSLLKDKYSFTDEELKSLNQEITKAVEALAWFEEKGLHPISPNMVEQLTDVTLRHYQEFKASKAGIALPTGDQASKLLKKK